MMSTGATRRQHHLQDTRMLFNNADRLTSRHHVVVPVTLHAGRDDSSEIVRSLHLELDTGSRQILLSGHTGDGLEEIGPRGKA